MRPHEAKCDLFAINNLSHTPAGSADFETKDKLCFALKIKKELFLRFSKAKNSHFGVSEAILFETVFETQKTIKKTKQVSF